eukprot:symbB.v1.2.041152.t1/scaffold7874.1/size8907/1
MGSGGSTEHKSLIEGKSPEEIAAALKELPPDQLAKIRACMKESCPGPVDCSSITVVAKDYKGMLPQPSAPKFKGALAQIYVRNQPYGGSDKSSNGHRYDSMCIVNGMVNAGLSCQLIHYTHEEHDKTTPPMPAGTTSPRKTRQRPRRWATSWERRHSRFFPSEARRSRHVSSIAPCTKSVAEPELLFSHNLFVNELNCLAVSAQQAVRLKPVHSTVKSGLQRVGLAAPQQRASAAAKAWTSALFLLDGTAE